MNRFIPFAVLAATMLAAHASASGVTGSFGLRAAVPMDGSAQHNSGALGLHAALGPAGAGPFRLVSSVDWLSLGQESYGDRYGGVLSASRGNSRLAALLVGIEGATRRSEHSIAFASAEAGVGNIREGELRLQSVIGTGGVTTVPGSTQTGFSADAGFGIRLIPAGLASGAEIGLHWLGVFGPIYDRQLLGLVLGLHF